MRKKGHSSDHNEDAKLFSERCSRLEQELAELRAERDLLQAVLNLIPDSIFAKDKDKNFILSNKKHFTSLGCNSLEDIIGKSDADFFPAALAAEFEAVDEEIMRGGEPLVVREEHGVEPTTGEENYILVSKALLGKEFGGGIAGIARNITVLKRALLAMEQAKEEAERANRAKNEFLGKMSHEVRTPLNGIMGISRLLMYTEGSLKNSGEQLQIIYDNAEALHSIISDMLDLTNIEAGNTRIHLRSFSLRSVVSESVNIIFVDRSDSSLRTEIQIEETVPDKLIGDAVKLRQVLINLLSNAKKFTLAGTVSINVSLLEKQAESLRLQFIIDDEGIGVAEKDRARIFDSFSQADNSLSRKYGGSGLGLSICRELLKLMQGKIEVLSPSPKTGKGSRFVFDAVFQVDQGESAKASVGKARDGKLLQELQTLSAGRGKESGGDNKNRLLLVEDNPVNQQIALAVLAKTGLQTDLAENGVEAVAACRKQDYALVLMDLQMPVMDGFAATREIRAITKGRGAQLPIIALTAQVLEGDRERCLKAGMNDYIPKPIKPEVLYGVLHKFLYARPD